VWASLNSQLFEFLQSVTLAELVRQQQKSDVVVIKDHRHSPNPPASHAPANAAV
jgi:DNA-binding IscR family transcriptional regulator